MCQNYMLHRSISEGGSGGNLRHEGKYGKGTIKSIRERAKRGEFMYQLV